MDEFMMTRPPTARKPLLGLTVLVVEDSHFACEAMRLLCLRSGARIRRADSLESAGRHLSVYRPSVMIVDVGLPDGSGLPLIETLAQATPRIDVLLGTSGDPDLEQAVLDAGADDFIAKPIASLAAFQGIVLRHLPADRQPPGPRLLSDEEVNPDLIAYQDDLNFAAQALKEGEELDYVTQFLGGVARSANDRDLDRAVKALADQRTAGGSVKSGVAALSEMVQSRIAAGARI